MENIKIVLIQPDIAWEKPGENLNKYTVLLENAEDADLYILPEMFTTGFSMESDKLKERMNGPAVAWMKKMAKKKNAAVTGSLIIGEEEKIFNRAVWVYPNGKLEQYDKKHLYTMGNETSHYSPGNQKKIVEFKGWKFCLMICYDLRFPVWSRNLENYDVLIYMANWPDPRHHVWKNLVVARALENQSYCIGVNRTGKDGTGLGYKGDSVVVSPKGEAEFMGQKEKVKMFELSRKELIDFRKKFPVLSDRDKFHLI